MIRICDPVLPDKELVKKSIDEIWETGQITNFGKYCRLFEEEVKNYTGAKYVVAVTNCDTALKLCVSALEMKTPILPTFTFNSTWMGAAWNTPQMGLADIDPNTLLIDLNYLEGCAKQKFTNYILVNTFGNMYDIDKLDFLKDKYDLNILFDSAHSFGSSYKGKKSGNLGYTECFSFSATKVITSGEGGIVCTDDEKIYEKLKYMRNYGFQGDYNSLYRGCNGKLSELNAIVGYHSMKVFNKVQERKKEVINKIKEKLKKKYTFQTLTDGVESSYKDFILLNVNFDKVSKALKKWDIEYGKYFLPLNKQTLVREDGELPPFPNAEKVYETSICIPAHSKLTDDEIDTMCGVLNNV